MRDTRSFVKQRTTWDSFTNPAVPEAETSGSFFFRRMRRKNRLQSSAFVRGSSVSASWIARSSPPGSCMSTDAQGMSRPPGRDSRIAGLYRMTVSERIDVLTERQWLDSATAARLKLGAASLSAERADRMVENVIGVFGLPLAVAPNFLVNGRDYVVPMVVEEASVVAAVSGAAKLARASGGFSVDAGESLIVGQIIVTNLADADAAMSAIGRAAGELVALANSLQPNLVERGGGARDVEAFRLRLAGDGAAAGSGGDASIVLCLLVDTRDAMGANTVNTMC